jgi:hypothetical protein
MIFAPCSCELLCTHLCIHLPPLRCDSSPGLYMSYGTWVCQLISLLSFVLRSLRTDAFHPNSAPKRNRFPQRSAATLSGRSAPGSHPIPLFPSIREFLSALWRCAPLSEFCLILTEVTGPVAVPVRRGCVPLPTAWARASQCHHCQSATFFVWLCTLQLQAV